MTDVGPIRSARRAAHLSQEEVARRAGCSTAYVRLLERGYAPGSSDVLPRVLEVLGLSLVVLLQRELGMTTRTVALRAGLTEGRLALIESGEAAPSRTEKEAIAGALEVSVDQAFPQFVSTGPGGDTREP